MTNTTQAPAEKIALFPVDSTALAAVGYNPEKQILAVQMKANGRIYHHAGVPATVAAEFNATDSVGRYYGQAIRGKYQTECMTGSCSSCGDAPGWIGDPCQGCGCGRYVGARRP